MIVIVLVCIIGQPCDADHARAYHAFRAPEGFAICALPGMLPLQNQSLSPQEGEEMHIRCRQ